MSTLDKLLKWGISQTSLCVLCNREVETHDHLFFHCCLTSEIWISVLKQLKARNWTTNWNEILKWLMDTTGSFWTSKFHKDLHYFGFAATVYGIWRERNQRLHQKIEKTRQATTHEILQQIKYNAISWKDVTKTKRNWDLALNFNLPTKIFKQTNTQTQKLGATANWLNCIYLISIICILASYGFCYCLFWILCRYMFWNTEVRLAQYAEKVEWSDGIPFELLCFAKFAEDI